MALTLNLRRQVFLAVSDNLELRNQIATRLHSNLACPLGELLYQSTDSEANITPAYPRLVTLRLNVQDPNPIDDINKWLAHYPPPTVDSSSEHPGKALPTPVFQIVGVEQLIKQPSEAQRLFLHYLKLAGEKFANAQSTAILESSILLWVSSPWLSAIRQSAPQFWRWHTGVFFFAGEPTPTVQHQSLPDSPVNSGDLDGLNEFEQSVGDKSCSRPQKIHNKYTLGNKPSLSSLSHISKKLTELVLATMNTNIAEYEHNNWQPQQLLFEIEELHSQQAPQKILSSAYHNLGNLYRLRIEQGYSNIQNLMVAILAYKYAIACDDQSPEMANILNDLGTLYWMLHRFSDDLDDTLSELVVEDNYIEEGIKFYHLALKLISPDQDSETYARVQNNLGTAYGDLARLVNPAENWENAVVAYSEALGCSSTHMEPLKYATCQNNLGTAYWYLGQYKEPVLNLNKAISSYKQALAQYSPEEEPLKYGMIQNNIGTAYWNLAQYEEPAARLQAAIDVYLEALNYRNSVDFPHACAATKNNLGTAYWHLANLPTTSNNSRQNLLQLSIAAYQEAIILADSLRGVPLGFDLFFTHNHLGVAHYQLVKDAYFEGDTASTKQHLQASLHHHLIAISEFNPQSEVYQATLDYVVKTIRAFHHELGVQGQSQAISQIPSYLLPEILRKL